MRYLTEDGHLLTEEDTYSFILSQMKQLKKEGYSKTEILEYDTQLCWDTIVKRNIDNVFNKT